MSNTANKPNAKCAICGTPYHMCMSCGKDKGLVWKRFCDTPEHYKIYQVVHGYTTGLYTKAEANKKLKNIDLSDIDKLRENIRNILNEIMNYSKKTNDVVDESPVDEAEDVEPEPAKPKQSSTKPRRTRKRSVAKTSDDMNDVSDDTKSEPVEA